jgi:glutamine synthetase adenylyltransferase
MPAALWIAWNAAEKLSLALLALLVAVVGLIAWRAWRDSRVSPEERERQRRANLVAMGKMGDAMLTEVHDDFIIYAYEVRGVEYTASQDVSRLKDRVPSDLSSLLSISIRYDPRNPANSIVVAEQWSGLHLESKKND